MHLSLGGQRWLTDLMIGSCDFSSGNVASQKATLIRLILCIREWKCGVAKHHDCASRP